MAFRTFLFLFGVTMFLSCRQVTTHSLKHHNLITIDSTKGTDSMMYQFIQPYRDSLEQVMNEVIGQNQIEMHSFKPESPLSNFVADLTLEAGIQFLDSSRINDEPVMSLVNTRGLRAALPQGQITVGNAFQIMPFENQMVAVRLNYEQMLLLFNHIAVSQGDGISGASFTLTATEPQNIKVQGIPLNKDTNYWVITSDYLADGGDDYTMFRSSEIQLTSPLKVRDLIISHIRILAGSNTEITPDKSIRITDRRNL
jgi:2',3'-cyclic-nucleotide 2'-phosphodiesterase (5'-nucleotidase family)